MYSLIKKVALSVFKDDRDYPLDSLMQETDVVLLMSSATNLKDFPWAFDARVAKTQF